MEPITRITKTTTIKIFDTLPSTQQYLIQTLKSNPNTLTIQSPSLTILAINQFAGIGRSQLNSSWQSFKGTLTFSFTHSLLSHKFYSQSTFNKNLIYFILKTIKNILLNEYNIKCFIKWPNDLYIDKHKICGIIVDVIFENIIVGIGINLCNEYANYKSIEYITGIKVDKIKFIESVVSNLLNDNFDECTFEMPEYLYFNGNRMKVVKVCCMMIVLEDEYEKMWELSAMEYQYDIKNQSIRKK